MSWGSWRRLRNLHGGLLEARLEWFRVNRADDTERALIAGRVDIHDALNKFFDSQLRSKG